MSKIKKDTGVITLKSNLSYFEWEIPNFCTCSHNVGNEILSPAFSDPSNMQCWKLKLYPKGETQEKKDWLSLFLMYYGNDNITVNAVLSLLDDRYNKVKEKDLEESIFSISGSWGYPEFVKHEFLMDRKNRLLKDGKLKILCEIIFKPDFVVAKMAGAKKTSDKVDVSIYEWQVSNNLRKLFESELYSDLTITVGENKLQAHKAIITSRSPVFDVMFKHEMKEKENNTIDITDVSCHVMKEVLRFMYTGSVNNIEKIIQDLLVAAEKYSVDGLKNLCEKSLYKTLNSENAIEFLKLADMCNADELKSQVIEFIAYNQKAVTEKPEFNLFGKLDSKLQCELVCALAAHNSATDLEMPELESLVLPKLS